jgi:amino acid adenylation domain-containing protein
MNKILLMLLPFHPPLIPPLGIACLKSFLKSHGFDVKTIDANTQEELRAHYSQYFDVLAEYIPLYHQANFHNIGNELLRNHMTACINYTNKKEYEELIKTIINKTFFCDIKNELVSRLNKILADYYSTLNNYLLDVLAKEKPDIYGLSVFKGTVPSSLFAAKLAKEKYPEMMIVMGGGVFADQLAYGSPELEFFIEKTPYVDKIIIGEGENLFLKLLRDELPQSQKVYTLKDIQPHYLDLSSVNTPDFSDYDVGNYPYLANYTSRSCPFQCTFCGETIFWGKYRKKKPEQIVDEIKELYQAYNRQLFLLCDSLLNPTIDKLCQGLTQHRLPVYYDGYLRVDKAVCDIENTMRWRRGGYYRARLGIESGSQRILDQMDKKITTQQIKSAVASLAHAGIKTTTYWIVGYPGETEEDFRKTLDLIEEMKDNIYEAEANPFWFYLNALVKSHDWAKHAGLLYPEQAKDMLILQTRVLKIDPTPAERHHRLSRFVQHCNQLGIPNPYSLSDIYNADKRWKQLHPHAVPAVNDFYKGNLTDKLRHMEEKKYLSKENVEEIWELSLLQKEIIQQLNSEKNENNHIISGAFVIKGHLEPGKIQAAWEQTVNRTPILRTVFRKARNRTVQVVLKEFPLQVEIIDKYMGTDVDNKEPENHGNLAFTLVQEHARTFNPMEEPPVDIKLVRLNDEKTIILLIAHEIILDKESLILVFQDFISIYGSILQEEGIPLPGRTSFKEYLDWLSRQYWAPALNHWKRELADFTSPTLLMGHQKFNKKEKRSYWFQRYCLTGELSRKLEGFCQQEGISPSSVIQAAWALLLSLYSRETDIYFGVRLQGRPQQPEAFQTAIGPFANTLPLRITINPNQTLSELIKKLDKKNEYLSRYSYIPLEEIRTHINLNVGTELFKTSICLQPPIIKSFCGGVQGGQGCGAPTLLEVVLFPRMFSISSPAPVTCTCHLWQKAPPLEIFTGEQWQLELSCFGGGLPETAAMEVLQRLAILLEKIQNNPGVRLSRLDYLTSGDWEKLRALNCSDIDLPPGSLDRFMHRVFESQVEKTPDAAACTWRDNQVSYRELNRRSNRIAHWLREQGIGPYDLVGICCQRGIEMLMAILAIFKAGGAYIPLDPDNPGHRIKTIIVDSGVKVIFTGLPEFRQILQLVGELPVTLQVFCLEPVPNEKGFPNAAVLEGYSTNNLSLVNLHRDPAYVFFTSGSTGTPKGVIVEHMGMLNHLYTKIQLLQLSNAGKVVQNASHCFDISVWQFLSGLMVGGQTVIFDNEVAMDPVLLLEHVRRHRVTVLEMVPAVIEMILEQGVGDGESIETALPDLGCMISTGEALPASLCQKWLEKYPGIPAVNAYGPTECSDDTHHRVVSPGNPLENYYNDVPLGTIIPNFSCYILDEAMRILPPGCVGEICLAGIGVGKGYLNDPERTVDAFVINPFDRDIGGRLYRSGDLGYYDANGQLVFLGRIDHQVKIRGFRIELGEIETQLRNHPAVKQCAVIMRKDAANNHQIIAYVTQKEQISPMELRAYLQELLPDYMIPAYILELETLPLNRSGKIDRKALPNPGDITQSFIQPELPGDTIEKTLVQIWEDVLEISPIRMNYNFFELGGHSLKIIQVRSRINRELGLNVSIIELFRKQTVGEQAEFIRRQLEEEGTLEHSQTREIPRLPPAPYYPMSHAQRRLFFFYQIDPANTSYNLSTALEFHDALQIESFKKALQTVTRRQAALRTTFGIIDNQPVQLVTEAVNYEICFKREDLSAVEAARQNHILAERLKQEANFTFDLTTGPLFYTIAFKIGEPHYLLFFHMHHIISDYWSWEIFFKELLPLYQSYKEKKEVSLPDLPIQYAEYAAWQNERIAKGDFQVHADYWKKQLAGELPFLELPFDFPRSLHRTFRGGAVNRDIPVSSLKQMRLFFRQAQVTTFIGLMAVFYAFFSRITGQQDIIVGTAEAGRNHVQIENLIGFFVNALPLRVNLEGDPTFSELLARVKKVSLEAYEHAEYPFDLIIEQLNLERNLSHHPLFSVGFQMNDTNQEEQMNRTSSMNLYNVPQPSTNFDLSITFLETENNLQCHIGYSKDLFKEKTLQCWFDHFIVLLEAVIAAPGTRVSSAPLLTAQQKEQLLTDWNDTPGWSPEPQTISTMFARQVEKTPDQIAVIGTSGIPGGTRGLAPLFNPISITYRELNKKSQQVAHLLRGKGVKPDTIVAIMADRSVEMVTGIIGILKSGGAYLPIDPAYPRERIQYMRADTRVSILLTTLAGRENLAFTMLQGLSPDEVECYQTPPRAQITNLDALQPVDRTTVNYEKYNRYIGQALVKHSISMQATRGCPYNCAYCHKIWPKKHVFRSAENIFNEVQRFYSIGVRRFVLIDDIFNLNIKNSSRFFQLIMDNHLDLRLFFPNGLRGDLLTKDYIDLMVKAGTVNIALALETASPRLQKLIGKHLNLEKLQENLEYLCENYPNVILELFFMHGFPTETKEEALQTLDFIKGLKWLHFTYFHILKIFPFTDMAAIARAHGLSNKTIIQSANLGYHQLPDTLPFDKEFTRQCQAEFLQGYFLLKERLLHVLPYQLKILNEDEILQKYNSYLPTEIKTCKELLEFVGIEEEELKAPGLTGETAVQVQVPDLNRRIKQTSPSFSSPPGRNALKILLLDLSQYLSKTEGDMGYDMVEPPLGLMYLLTALKREFGDKINGKIAKSRIDFSNYRELKHLIEEFKPDIIGIRTLTYYRDFFHQTAAMIRHWRNDAPIIAGGPYATSDYQSLLQDKNINLAVLGEGEHTLCDIVSKMLKNDKKLPGETGLKQIPGIAYVPGKQTGFGREIIILDALHMDTPATAITRRHPGKSNDTAYVIYTSGTTGKPRGVMVQHGNITGLMKTGQQLFHYNHQDVWTMFHSPCFDFSVWEIFGALLSGGKLLLIPRNIAIDTEQYLDWVNQYGVTILNQTPSAFYRFMDIEASREKKDLQVRTVIFGGEALTPGKLKQWRARYPQTRLINMFGITETTVHVTCKEITDQEIDENLSCIGKPIPTLTAYMMDANRQLLPAGFEGELYIGGPGVARGYLNKPGLTRERFIQNPHKKGERLYRSGDLIRLLENREMLYKGRTDHQVQLRGYRVEPAEIENRLLDIPGIKEAVVIARENEPGDKYLCAYIVTNDTDEALEIENIKTMLTGSLPGYMIPSFFIKIVEIPLTASGKINRKVLPAPGFSRVEQNPDLCPDAVQQKLQALWARVLNIEKENIHSSDNFFDLGGHSLKATILVSQVHKELKVKVPLDVLFKTPTIRELSQYIHKAAKERYVLIEPVEKKEYYHLSSAQKRMYIINRMEPGSTAYNLPLFIPLTQEFSRKKLENSIKKLIKRHESLRTSFHIVNNNPVQKINKDFNFEITYFDFKTSRVEVDVKVDDIEGTRGLAPLPSEPANRGSQPAASTIKDFIRPFDLSRAPLLRVGVIPSQEGRGHKYILVVDMHHIITDGTSQSILTKEFQAMIAGEGLSPLRLQYKDFSEWQYSEQEKEHLEQQETYWLKQFAGEIPVLHLPVDFPRPPVQDFEGRTLGFELDKKQTRLLEKLALDQGATLFMVLLAIIDVLLSKISNMDDIAIGTPIAGRRHGDLRQIIGFFVNTLVLRNFPNGEKTAVEFIHEVKQRTLKAFENQDYQFEELVEKVKVPRDLGRNPLFDVMFVFQNSLEKPINIPGKNTGEETTAKFDLTIIAAESEDKLIFFFEYAKKLFKKKTIERFISYFKKIVLSVIADPGQKIFAVDMVPEQEKKQVLREFNNTGTHYPKDKTIHELFAEQVERTPDHVAAAGPPQVKNRTYLTHMTYISYGELNEKSNQLARLLQEKGVEIDTTVGIISERSIDMIIGMLGILKAGGAYLPMDPDYPAERINYMLSDSSAKILVTSPVLSGKFEKLLIVNCQLLMINDKPPGSRRLNNPPQEANSINNYQLTINNLQLKMNSLAYIIYTSGSTGRPKGVLIRHRGFVNLITCHQEIFGENNRSRISQVANPAFDAMAFEVWPALSSGASLVIAGNETLLEPAKMKEWLIKESITISFQPTALAERLLDEKWTGTGAALKVLRTGGDRLTRYPAHPYPFRFFNLYGPTEDTVCTTWTEIKPDVNPGKYPAVGKPLGNHQVYILGPNWELQPIGINGELCISGIGLAPGYLNNPELTAEKFCLRRPGAPRRGGPICCANRLCWNSFVFGSGRDMPRNSRLRFPSSHLPNFSASLFPPPRKNFLLKGAYKSGYHRSSRSYKSYILYRTGDLARWLPNGDIEFSGRIGHQVKIRGFRIEPEEIENHLLSHNQIKETLVIAKEDTNGDKYLCAYLVFNDTGTGKETNESSTPEANELREFLSKQLPGYMVPHQFINVKKIPLTPQGKADRNALAACGEIIGTGTQYQPPQNLTQQTMANLWKEVLKVETVSINDNFFQLGGHSLNALQLTSKLKDKGINISIREIFYHQTIKAIAQYISDRNNEDIPLIDTLDQAQPKELKNDIPVPLEQFSDRLKQELAQFNEAIIKNKTVKQYKPSPIQQCHLGLEHRWSGTFIAFDKYLDIPLLEEAFLELIRDQGLFRSTLAGINNKEGELSWNELQAPLEITLPFVDLTDYSPEIQEKLINHILQHVMVEDFKENSLLYRVVLFQKNLRNYFLVIYLDHSIFDAASAEIVKQSLLNAYRLKERIQNQEPIPPQPKSPIKPYEEYIQQISRGPLDIGEDEMIRVFRLEEFCRYKRKFETIILEKQTNMVHSYHYELPLEKVAEEKVWEVSFLAFTLFLTRYFQLSKVPLKVVSYGRRYRENNFFSTVGEFLDLVPVLAYIDKDKPVEMLKEVRKKLDRVQEHNINFMSLLYDNLLKKKWQKTANLIAPEQLEPNDLMILFNFIGNLPGEKMNRLTQPGKAAAVKQTKICTLHADIYYDSCSIYFHILTSLELDTSSLKIPDWILTGSKK